MSASNGHDISIRLNGEERRVPPGLSVRDLILSLDLRPEMIVVEHNRDILTRDRYDEVTVREGDVLELVHFVGGG